MKGGRNLLYSVDAVLGLDSEGKRLLAKFYTSDMDLEQQKSMEALLYKKTARSSSDILMVEDYAVVYQAVGDLKLFLLSRSDENEVMLATVLNTLVEALKLLLMDQVNKQVVIDNYDYVMLVIDELFDDGVLLESEPQILVDRVVMKGAEAELPLAEQSFSSAMRGFGEQLSGFLKG